MDNSFLTNEKSHEKNVLKEVLYLPFFLKKLIEVLAEGPRKENED